MEDEYDDIDFSQFTAEDFAQIDALTSSRLQELGPSKKEGLPGPSIAIELEEDTDTSVTKELNARGASDPSKKLSPFERFRARMQALTVTDLVSPAW